MCTSCHLRPYVFRPDRTSSSPVITHLQQPDRGRWNGLVAPSTPIFSVKIRPTGADTLSNRTQDIGVGSLGPLRPYFFRPDRTISSRVITHLEQPDRGHWTGLLAPSMPIFFQPDPTSTPRANRPKEIRKDSSRPLRPYFFHPDRTNRSQVITSNRIVVVEKSSSRPLRPNFFRPDRTNRSRVITHLEQPDWGRWKGLVAPSTPIFLYPDRTNRSRVITV
ncbi:hypothetical protein V1477_006257 [Vespula maculifrons]|uniref:Uncharacterized protein n=1 Tax=Vespula maculifrons TaxID=7453 RepID=A0ABD2CJY3_VESMC